MKVTGSHRAEEPHGGVQPPAGTIYNMLVCDIVSGMSTSFAGKSFRIGKKSRARLPLLCRGWRTCLKPMDS